MNEEVLCERMEQTVFTQQELLSALLHEERKVLARECLEGDDEDTIVLANTVEKNFKEALVSELN